MRLKLYASEPQHQSLPAFLVTARSLSLYTPQQPDCRPATGARDRNIAEILEIAQLSFLAANRYPRNSEHGTVAAPPIPIYPKAFRSQPFSLSGSASLAAPKAPIHLSRPQKNHIQKYIIYIKYRQPVRLRGETMTRYSPFVPPLCPTFSPRI